MSSDAFLPISQRNEHANKGDDCLKSNPVGVTSKMSIKVAQN